MKRILLVLGLFIAIGSVAAQCSDTTIVQGKALDLYDNPISGADISAERMDAGPDPIPVGSNTTNAAGDYIISLDISKLDADNKINLKLEKDEKTVETGEFDVSCGEPPVYKDVSYGMCLSPTTVGGNIYYTDNTKVSIPMSVTAYIDGYEAGSSTSSATGEYTVAVKISTAGKSDLLVAAESDSFIGNKSESKAVWCNYEKKSFNIMVDKKPVAGSDETPPNVTSRGPEGANVPVITKIEVTFSEAMNTPSVEGAFSASPPITGTFAWVSKKMIFTPTNSLAYNTTYTVTINTGAKDMADNPLPGSYTWQFTTEKEQTPGIIPPGGGGTGTIPGGGAGTPPGGEQPTNETGEQPTNETGEQPVNETGEQPANETGEQPANETTGGSAQPANDEPESQQPGKSQSDPFGYILLILIIATIAIITYFIYLYYVKYKI